MSDTIPILQEAITSDNDSQVLRTIDILLGTIPYPFNTANLDALIASCTISKNVLIQKLAKACLEFIKDPKSDKKDALVNRDPLLLWACDKNMPNMAEALLSGGANPNVADVNGDTPLLVACDRKQAIVANQLISSGVNVNASNSLGITPIILCTKNDMPSVVTALIDKGATPPAPVVPAPVVPAPVVPAPVTPVAAPVPVAAPAPSASAPKNMPMIGDIVNFLELGHITPRKLMYITTPNDNAYTFDITSTLQNRKAEIQMNTINRTTAHLTENYTLTMQKLSANEHELYSVVMNVLRDNPSSVENIKKQILAAIQPILIKDPSVSGVVVDAAANALKATGTTTSPVRIWTRKKLTGGGRRLRLTSAAE